MGKIVEMGFKTPFRPNFCVEANFLILDPPEADLRLKNLLRL